ncbi:MAG: MATE family efflux transporter [Clostridia bacterium]|nr:MATE family efflux transporter [Clostridia bacterium]
MLKSFFGDKHFYKKVLALALPIMLQNGITNFVNMLDNLMVGSLGIGQSAGVNIAGQLLFVFNLCMFGAISGAGIFGAQFYGKGDNKGLTYAFRFKLIVSLLIGALGIGLFYFLSDPLINIYQQSEGGAIDPAFVFSQAKSYLQIMLIGLLPFALTQCYSGTLRECGRPTLPMIAGTVAVLVNLVFNYVLIFGNFGAPELGVRGAAVATVISRFVELVIVVIFAHARTKKTPFMKDVFKSLYIPKTLVFAITAKTIPLMANEVVWATGMATINKFYSERGIEVVAANNVLQTFFNVFSVAYMAVGMSLGILLGQKLGETTHKPTVMDYCKKLITTSVLVNTVMGVFFFIGAFFIPSLYNFEGNESARALATQLMQVCAVMMPFEAMSHAMYFTLRSGGKTLITFLFDSGYVWVIDVLAAALLVRFTSVDIIYIYLIVQILNALRCALGYIFVKRGSWIRNIVE